MLAVLRRRAEDESEEERAPLARATIGRSAGPGNPASETWIERVQERRARIARRGRSFASQCAKLAVQLFHASSKTSTFSPWRPASKAEAA